MIVACISAIAPPVAASNIKSYWLLDDIPVVLHINPNFTDEEAGSPSAQVEAIVNAMDTWQSEGKSLFYFVNGDPTTAVNASGSISAIHDSAEDTCPPDLPCGCSDGTLAWTEWETNVKTGLSWMFQNQSPVAQSVLVTYRIVFCDHEFTFYSPGYATDGASIQCVALHELGHVLGLDHEYKIAGAIMNSLPACEGDAPQLTLASDDIAGLQKMYGSTSGDADADGLSNGLEQQFGSNAFVTDSDGDGLTDGAEVNGTPYATSPTKKDTDDDGLNDKAELQTYNTDPTAPDSDGDLLDDPDELKMGTNPMKADTDGDGLIDGTEVYTLKTSPLEADTDGDQWSDSEELAQGSDPLVWDNPALLAPIISFLLGNEECLPVDGTPLTTCDIITNGPVLLKEYPAWFYFPD